MFPEAYIANPSAAGDEHHSLEITVTKRAAITVTNDRTHVSEAY